MGFEIVFSIETSRGSDRDQVVASLAWIVWQLPGSQNITQPRLNYRSNLSDLGERQLAFEAVADIRREANLGSKRVGRTLFDPGADDQEAGVIERHERTLERVASRGRYGYRRSLISA